MDTYLIFRLIFWIGVLGAWCIIVYHGIKWIEAGLDSLLDRWFD